MPLLFNNFVESIVKNLSKTESDYLAADEKLFIQSLFHENLQFLVSMFDEIKKFEINNIVKPQDISSILFVIITFVKAFVEVNREKRVKNILNVCKFLLITISGMVAYTGGLNHDELKTIINVSLTILETNSKNKRLSFISFFQNLLRRK